MAVKATGTGSCVAINLGATVVRAVEVEWIKTGSDTTSGRVVRMGTASLPSEAWNDLVASREAFAAAIREALQAGGISARSVVADLPRRLVTVRFARLPHAPPEQMRSMVAFEAQQYILFSLDEVILDYHVLPELTGFTSGGGDDMDTVLLAAARRTLVAELTAIFDQAGVELERLSVSALALAEHIRDALEPTAIIHIEPGEMDVAAVADGHLLFTRASALHTENVLPEVALRRVMEEVARSFTAYQNEFRHQPLAHIYLAGSGAPGLEPEASERMLSDVLGMPVTYLHPRLLDPSHLSYATAVGVALQTRSDSIAPINLYPNERAVQRAQQAKKQRGILAAALLVILAIGGVSVAMSQWEARNKAWKATVRANQALNEVTAQVEARKKSYTRLQELENDLKSGLDRAHPAVDVLAALDHALPPSAAIWLTQFAFDRGGLITLRGETKSEAAATDLVLSLQRTGAFADVKLGYLGDTEDTNNRSAPPAPGATGRPARATLTSFIITCRVNPSARTLLPARTTSVAPATPARGTPLVRPVGNRSTQDEGDLLDEMGDEFGDQ